MSGFGAKFRAQSRQAIAARATPQSGLSQEAIWDCRYDTQLYISAATTRMVFFSQVQADKTLSNMEASGQFPAPQSFQIYNVACDILPATAGVSTSTTVAGNLNDMALLLLVGRPTWTLTISSKQYGPYPLTALHGTGGPSGFGFSSDGTNVLQYARNEPSGGWNYQGAIIIPEQVAFSIEVNFAAAQTLTGNPHIRLSMFGVLNRRVV